MEATVYQACLMSEDEEALLLLCVTFPRQSLRPQLYRSKLGESPKGKMGMDGNITTDASKQKQVNVSVLSVHVGPKNKTMGFSF